MLDKTISIHWFRRDLRIEDNPSLDYLNSLEEPIMCIYVLDEINNDDKIGQASKYFLNESLKSLNSILNNCLHLFKGCAFEILESLLKDFKIKNVSWNRCYEPCSIKRDKKIKSFLENEGINVKSFNGSLLWEPWTVLKKDETPYKVFSPYYKRGCLESAAPRYPIKSKKFNLLNISNDFEINKLKLLPKNNWYRKFEKIWKIDHCSLKSQVADFFEKKIQNYKLGRNFPAKHNVSRLSPYIHFGLVSPNMLWYECENLIQNENVNHFKSELGWREFSYYLLYHFPQITKKNLQVKFDKFPWKNKNDHLVKWQKGLTGYPIVDAGMRELWQTGYMHNRVRMIVGSFLVKNLLIHWKEGEKWFWDCLLDADLANNNVGWQWVAGTGADAAPYFRIFNPISQGEKFDTDGEYTKKYIPELKNLPSKYLFCPWAAPEEVLKSNSIKLGLDYPYPIVDIKQSRELALKCFSAIKS